MSKTLKTTEELSDLTAVKVKRSELSILEIAKKLGISIKSINHGISKGQRSNPGRNGIRRKILLLFGYEVSTVFIVNKVQKN